MSQSDFIPLRLPSSTEEVANPIPHAPLRFKIGDMVDCNVENTWLSGHVVALHYTEPGFPHDCTAPYQVRLLRGCLVFAPHDEDGSVRRSFDDEEQPRMEQAMNNILNKIRENTIGDDTGDGMRLPFNHVRALAKLSSLTDEHHPTPYVLMFARGGTIWMVDCLNAVVTTELTHPTRGRTSRDRPEVDLPLLQNLFRDPRLHTGCSMRTGQTLRNGTPRTHNRKALIHDDLNRWRYILDEHRGHLSLTHDDEVLFLTCCQVWIDNFFPFKPDGSVLFSEHAKCAMSTFTVTILKQVDELELFHDTEGTPVYDGRHFCCPQGPALLQELWKDNNGKCQIGLEKLGGALAQVHKDLRLGFCLFYYSKASHEELFDGEGKSINSIFEDAHIAYGLRTYEAATENNAVCPCHGTYCPFPFT